MQSDDVLTIAGLFYDGILSEKGWQEALAAIAAATDSEAASLVLWDRKRDQALVGDQVGLPPELSTQYAAHYHLLDPGRQLIDQCGLGQWYLDERDFGVASMRQSAFYQDFLAKYALDSTMAAPIMRGRDGVDGFLSLSSRAGGRDIAAVASSLSGLMPHIQRAANLRTRFLALSQHNYFLHDVLDRVALPLILLAQDGRVVLANRRGEAFLSQQPAPLTDKDEVRRAVHDACGEDRRRAESFRMMKADGSPYYLSVLPLPESSHVNWQFTFPTALVVVNDPAERIAPPEELLRQLFGLSGAEARVAQKLREGLTVQEASTELGVTAGTVRTQLKSVFLKLGVRRQSELQRLLAKIDIIDKD